MTATESTLHRAVAAPRLLYVVFALAILTGIRIVGLNYSVVDLYVDEAQYWAWSRELAFGYFSKPPLLAWIIAASDVICGNGETCVRVASPVFYFAMSLIIYAIARELYDRGTAAWSALAFALCTGAVFSARIISTDVPLLLFWALALLAYVRLLATPSWPWAGLLGIALGLGLLAKYAMVYFLICAICAATVDRGARSLLNRREIWTALGIAALIVFPNLAWNVSNDFVTFRHSGENITGGGLRFRPIGLLAFIGAQFAVAGPLVFATFLVIAGKIRRYSQLGREDWLMLSFAVPPLALVTALSLVRNANPNWAAPAFVGMTILVVAWWLRMGRWRLLWGTLAIGLIWQAELLVADAHAYRVTVSALGAKADLYQRTLGWRSLGSQVAGVVHSVGAPTVATEGRAEAAALTYYLRSEPTRPVTWAGSRAVQHHFEMSHSLDDTATEPVLMITTCADRERLQRFFAEVTPLPTIVAASGPSSARRYQAFLLANRQRAIEPLRPCPKLATP